LQSLERLLDFPWINEGLKAGTLQVNGWYFDFESGDLLAYNSTLAKFEPIADIEIPIKKPNAKSPGAIFDPELYHI
jgi:hypothetical protein